MGSVTIYSSDSDACLLGSSYISKGLLYDSIERTQNGWSSIASGNSFSGVAHILIARVESAVAFVFVAISSLFHLFLCTLLSPFFLATAIPLNLVSRLPVLSSFKCVQDFTKESSDGIYRTFKIHAIAAPVILLFLSEAAINTCLPGLLSTNNVFNTCIHKFVETLGPLQRIDATLEDNSFKVQGAKEKLSPLSGFEEYIRGLSFENRIQEEHFTRITVVREYTRYV